MEAAQGKEKTPKLKAEPAPEKGKAGKSPPKPEELTREAKKVQAAVSDQLKREMPLKRAILSRAEEIKKATELISQQKAHQASYIFEGEPIPQGLIEQNPEAAYKLIQIAAAAKDLHQRYDWLMEQGKELAATAGGDVEKLAQLASYLKKIEKKVEELLEIAAQEKKLSEKKARELKLEAKVYITPIAGAQEEEEKKKEILEEFFGEKGGEPPEIPEVLKGTPVERLIEQLQERTTGGIVTDFGTFNDYYRRIQQGLVEIEDPKRRAAAIEAAEPVLNRMGELVALAGGGRFYQKLTPQKIIDLQKPENHQLRDQEFYGILERVILNRAEPTRETYGLYERADMSLFLTIIRGMPGGIPEVDTELANHYGTELANHYIILNNAIRQAHDIDYYASHPMGEMKSFVTSASLFKNEFWEQAHKDPLVEVMMRCYFQALMMIRDNNNGYIPPGMVEFNPGLGYNYLDNLARKLFLDKVRLGKVYDVKRKEYGMPETNRYHKGVPKDKPLTVKEIYDPERPEKNLRLEAVMNLAKGCDLITLHFLEIIAYSRVPGFDSPWAPSFSSKAYEGIARYINWLRDLGGKYNYGDTLSPVFFSLLANEPYGLRDRIRDAWGALKGGKVGKALEELFGKKAGAKTIWRKDEIERSMEAASEGRLEEVFGEGALRTVDIPQLGRMCGYGGPQSMWRIMDSTVYYDEEKKETLGGSIRLALADIWAERVLREKYVEGPYREKYRQELNQRPEFNFPSFAEPQKWTEKQKADFEKSWAEEAMRKDVYGGKIISQWEKLKPRYEEEIKNLAKAYKTMALVQLVMRNPVRAASIVEIKEELPEGMPRYRMTLRDKIIKKVLKIDLAELSGCYRLEFGTPTKEMIEKQNQVAELEGVINALHEETIRYVEDEKGNIIHRPRDLEDKDFEKIEDEDLRKKAKEYWEMVKREVLGSWDTVEKWRQEIGWEYFEKEPGRKELRIMGKIDDVLKKAKKDAAKAGLPTPALLKLIPKEWGYLFGPEDVSWGLMDTMGLGARHWLRRAGDLGAYAEGVNKAWDFLRELSAKPDYEKLVDFLGEIKKSFEGYDIAAGHEVAYRFAYNMIRLYDQEGWAKIPGIGGYFSLLFPSSIAKKVYGIPYGDALSANDKRGKILDPLRMKRILPAREWIYGRKWPYNMERLEKAVGAQTVHMIYELLIRGMVIAALMMAISALTKKEEEE